MEIGGRVPHDKLGKRLGEAVAVKDKGVPQLAEGKRLEEPAAPPPGSLALDAAAVLPLLPPPDKAFALAEVPAILEGAEQGEDGDGDAELLGRVDAQGQAGERGADGGGQGRRQGGGGAGVAEAEGPGGVVEEVQSEAGEEAEEDAVEKEDGREGEGEAEGGRFVEWLFLGGRAGSALALLAIPRDEKWRRK